MRQRPIFYRAIEEHMSEKNLITLLFLCPGILALIVLLCFGIVAKTYKALVIGGVLALFFFVVQIVLLCALIGWGAAWSGSQGRNPSLERVLLSGLIGFTVYGVVAAFKLNRRPRE
jgi:hypothetical protein